MVQEENARTSLEENTSPKEMKEEEAPDEDFEEADASASETEAEEEPEEEYSTEEEIPADVRLKISMPSVRPRYNH
jgi:hypothetical protein